MSTNIYLNDNKKNESNEIESQIKGLMSDQSIEDVFVNS